MLIANVLKTFRIDSTLYLDSFDVYDVYDMYMNTMRKRVYIYIYTTCVYI